MFNHLLKIVPWLDSIYERNHVQYLFVEIFHILFNEITSKTKFDLPILYLILVFNLLPFDIKCSIYIIIYGREECTNYTIAQCAAHTKQMVYFIQTASALSVDSITEMSLRPFWTSNVCWPHRRRPQVRYHH